MPNQSGKFVWYELLTTDPTAAITFYKSVIGWTAGDSGLTDRGYTRLSAGDVPVAGLMELPAPVQADGGHPFWIGYIGVDDTDAALVSLTEAGGATHRPPETIPGVGRFAVVSDPQGAPYVLFAPATPIPPAQPASFAPGHIGWHELHAADRETAFAFYAAHYGWTAAGSFDMGPMGLYQLFDAGEATIGGGIMTKTANIPTPVWIYYFNVDHIEHAVDRAKGAGGQLLNGPHQVPTGQWIAQCLDPQGAFFAMVAPDHT